VHNIGKYFDREIFWLDYNNLTDQLPEKDWVCLAIANNQPDYQKFDNFARKCISKNILDFKGQGKFGERLHDLFDKTIEVLETKEGHREIEVITTGHEDEILADAFWQCFYTTFLPDTADIENITIICTDLDGIDRTKELQDCLKEFELGWLPSDNVKHEIWEDPEGLTTLCPADETGDGARNLLEPSSKLIHCFYAESHFEAMQIYYKFMDWGTYTTEFEIDKQPYKNKNVT